MATRQTLMSFQHFFCMLPAAPLLLIAKQAKSLLLPSPHLDSIPGGALREREGEKKRARGADIKVERREAWRQQMQEVQISSLHEVSRRVKSFWRNGRWQVISEKAGFDGSSWTTSSCPTASNATSEISKSSRVFNRMKRDVKQIQMVTEVKLGGTF